IASGFAMKVFDGQRTTPPLTSAKLSAASAAPVQLDMATAPTPFQLDHSASNASDAGPCDQIWRSKMSSQSACSNSLSRRWNPIAKVSYAGEDRVVTLGGH